MMLKTKKEATKMEAMELSEKKIEELRKQPVIETKVRKSNDGRWVIHQTKITDIKPVNYFEKVLEEL